MLLKIFIIFLSVKFSQGGYRSGLWRTRENDYNSKRTLDSYEDVYNSQNNRNDRSYEASYEKKKIFDDYESQYRRDFTTKKHTDSYLSNNNNFGKSQKQFTTSQSYDSNNIKNNFGREDYYNQFTTKKYSNNDLNTDRNSNDEKIYFNNNEDDYNKYEQTNSDFRKNYEKNNKNNYNSNDFRRPGNDNRKSNTYVSEVNEYSNSVYQSNNNDGRNSYENEIKKISDYERNESKREYERPQSSSDSKNNEENLLANENNRQNENNNNNNGKNNVNNNNNNSNYSNNNNGNGNNGVQGGSKRNLIPEKKCGLDVPRRIIGGTKTDIDEFPWMGLLQYVDSSGNVSHDCSGVLISKRYILTAAHCTNGANVKSREIKLQKVRLGEWDVSTEKDCQGDVCSPNTQEIDIEDIIPHEGYKPKDKSQVNDIALIRLKNEANLNQFVQPICLPFDKIGNTDYEGKKLTVAGWGKTSNARNSASEIKMKVDLPVVSWERCRQFYKSFYGDVQIKESQFCAGGEEGQDSCRGDSGGPLMTIEKTQSEIKWYVIGVVSSGPAACGMQDRPSLYTNVSQFTDWILENIRS